MKFRDWNEFQDSRPGVPGGLLQLGLELEVCQSDPALGLALLRFERDSLNAMRVLSMLGNRFIFGGYVHRNDIPYFDFYGLKRFPKGALLIDGDVGDFNVPIGKEDYDLFSICESPGHCLIRRLVNTLDESLGSDSGNWLVRDNKKGHLFRRECLKCSGRVK